MDKPEIIKKPIGLSEAELKAENMPCKRELINLIKEELGEGNILLSMDKVSMFPDETYYICQFKYFSKTKPYGLKMSKMFDYEQEIISFSDRNGVVEIRFNCHWEIEKA